MISISTAPTDRSEGIFEATRQKALRVINGAEVDPAFFAWLCEPPAGLDPDAPDNWHWSNPSLGYTITLERLKANFAAAQQDPAALRDFRSQNLNIQPDESAGVERWLAVAQWDAAADDTLTLEALLAEARWVYVGVDAGGLDDLSAIGVLGKTQDDRFLFWSHQWISRRGYEKRRTINPYDDWIAAGELTLFEGGGGDIAGFVEVVELVAAAGKLSLIGIDAYGATELAGAFLPSRADVEAVPQGWKLTPTLSWVERRLADDQLRHDASPIMRWNIGNAVVTRNGNASSISKQTVVGAGKIDGVAALLNAVAALLARASVDVPSIYETQGLLII